MDKYSSQDSALLKKRNAAAKAKLARIKAEPVIIDSSVLAINDEPIKLPFGGEYRDLTLRSVPNSILRSALFGAIQHGERAFQQRVKKASVDGILLIQTGPILDQADLDVWLQCLEYARMDGVGNKIWFSAGDFLENIDRDVGGENIKWLKGAFARLSSSVVEIQDGRKAYFGPLIVGGARDDVQNQYVIEINPKILSLFGPNSWSTVDVNHRRLLRRRPLAQWLHGFYLSHAKPWPYKIETLHKLCGSENKNLKSFKQQLGEALVHLAEITGWWCDIDGDFVHVTKSKTTRTPSQVRHVERLRLAA